MSIAFYVGMVKFFPSKKGKFCLSQLFLRAHGFIVNSMKYDHVIFPLNLKGWLQTYKRNVAL